MAGMDRLKRYFLDTSSSREDVWVVFLYILLVLILGTVFHEPWFDESTAWMIARTNSVYDILFNIPHYEGHIPLWHLVLKLVMLSHLPYELSLVFVNLLFLVPAIVIIVFKSGFPRIIRLLLPFSYFLFYQYGMISRPYSIMICALMLLALFYPNRDKSPVSFVLSLALLCCSSVYGIVLSFGIVISWLIEIFINERKKLIKSFKKDKRFYSLLGLFVLALILCCLILPRVDSITLLSVSTSHMRNGFFTCLLYMLFSSISDSLVTNAFSSYTLLQNLVFNPILFGISTFVGMLSLYTFIKISLKKGTFLLFIIPYLLFCLFSSGIYFYTHHIGIMFVFILFWSIVSYNKEENKIDKTKELKDIKTSTNDIKFRQYLVRAVVVIMLVQLYWTVTACISDIKYPYSCGRSVASFIKDNHLDNYNILAQWQISDNLDASVSMLNVNSLTSSSNILPYFDKDIFMNFDSTRRGFNPHKLADWKTNQQELALWRKRGIPDMLLFEVDLPGLYNSQDLTFKDFKVVYCALDQRVFKDKVFASYGRLFIRSDILDRLELKVQTGCGIVKDRN